MKLNDEVLEQLLITKSPSHQGILLHQPPKGSPKNKVFKLIDNLLFYHRTGDTSEDVGFFLMEKCVIDLVGVYSQGSRRFSIVFEGESNKKHYFTAPTVVNCTSWMNALQMASYINIKAEILNLQNAIFKRTGHDPVLELKSRIVAETVSMNGQKDGPSQMNSRKHSKPRQKITSTFYTSSENKTIPLKDCKASGPQSTCKFFTTLDVVKAGNNSDVSSVSSGVGELRKKAMTMDQRTRYPNQHDKQSSCALILPNHCLSKNSTSLHLDLKRGQSDQRDNTSHLYPSANFSVPSQRSSLNTAGQTTTSIIMESSVTDHTDPLVTLDCNASSLVDHNFTPKSDSSAFDLIDLNFMSK